MTDKIIQVANGMPEDHHYYATFALGWRIGRTREEAIAKLVDAFRSDFKEITRNQHKAGEPGAYIWSCRVDAPADSGYRIEFYAPKGVETSEHREHFTTYVTKKDAAWWTAPKKGAAVGEAA